jgi:hypothetical protein
MKSTINTLIASILFVVASCTASVATANDWDGSPAPYSYGGPSQPAVPTLCVAHSPLACDISLTLSSSRPS